MQREDDGEERGGKRWIRKRMEDRYSTDAYHLLYKEMFILKVLH